MGMQEIFSRILDRQLTWPEDEEVSPECRDLVDRLLQLDPFERLGHRGAGEIKLHPWFQGLDWTSLARTKAAFIPAVESETDTSYFFDKPVCTSILCTRPSGLLRSVPKRLEQGDVMSDPLLVVISCT